MLKIHLLPSSCGVPGDSVSGFAARHDVSEPIAAWKTCLETSLGMGVAGAAEGCKDVLLVAFAEGGVLSGQPWKALERGDDRMEKSSELAKQCISDACPDQGR